jgi:hypothetical protein
LDSGYGFANVTPVTNERKVRMTKLLLIAAGLGLAVSGAQACDFQRTAKANKVDDTTVASISLPQSEPVAIPEPSDDKSRIEKTTE